MRGAPPVRMACGGDARWLFAECLSAALACATISVWLALQAGLGGVACGALAVAAAALAGWSWLRWARCATWSTLTWDGQAWTLDGQAADLELMLEIGSWMLLRVHPHGTGVMVWLPLNLRRSGSSAHLCRVAIHAHAAQIGADRSQARPADANG